MLQGDALMLREAFKNVVDNALKHGRPERGPVDVCVQAQTDPANGQALWCVVVEDCGPGVPEAEQARMFDRFARGAGAAPGGAGLGLAIVQRVVQGHGGQVQVGHRAAGGWRVALTLPVTRTMGATGSSGATGAHGANGSATVAAEGLAAEPVALNARGTS
jgi:two-component system, OmpR family, sensor histidine kinase TctE